MSERASPEPKPLAPTSSFALFETAIGTCGVAWTDRGLAGVQLPEASATSTRSRLQRRFPDAVESEPPPDIAATIAQIIALLLGERVDLSAIVVDYHGVPPFDREVYRAAREIPPGATLTYGEIATRIGRPGTARDVGVALARNPFAIVVPCHRVVAANGRLGGFSGSGGTATKLRLLGIEGGAGPLFD